MLPVAQHDIAHVANSQAIHQHRFDIDLPRNLTGVAIQLQNIAIVENKRISPIVAQIRDQIRMAFQVTEFTVNRYKILWLYQAVDQLQLFLARMSGYVRILENNIRSLFREFIDDIR